MSDITDLTTCVVSISPASLGVAFAKMDSTEQAEFFQGVYSEVSKWGKSAGFQWVRVRDHLKEMPDALSAFKELAEYGPDYDSDSADLVARPEGLGQ